VYIAALISAHWQQSATIFTVCISEQSPGQSHSMDKIATGIIAANGQNRLPTELEMLNCTSPFRQERKNFYFSYHAVYKSCVTSHHDYSIAWNNVCRVSTLKTLKFRHISLTAVALLHMVSAIRITARCVMCILWCYLQWLYNKCQQVPKWMDTKLKNIAKHILGEIW